MSSVSAKLETLAETHCVNPLVLLEFYLERLAAIKTGTPNAEQLAIEEVAAELEGRK